MMDLVGLGIGWIILAVLGIFMFVGVYILAFVFWIVMIVDAAQRKFHSDGDKVVWILVLIFLSILGAIIYYFIIKRKDKRKDKSKRRK